MKKFFLMLAVALPMFFMTACGDDDDDVTYSYTMPILTKSASDVLTIGNLSATFDWGASMDEVKATMKPFSYVLNSGASTSTALAYTYDAAGAMPFYVYAFNNNSLLSSSITVTEQMDEQVDFDKYFKDNGYKEISTDDDEDFIYQSKDKATLVHYGYDGNVTLVWTLNVRSDYRQVLYTHLSTVEALMNAAK